MRVAYADPPYVGQSKKHYGGYEVNHPALINHLVSEFPDGWALSASSPSLRFLLPLCPEDVRVGAWVKPFASFKKNVTLAYAWEPVMFCGGRRRPTTEPTVRDWAKDEPCVVENITLQKGMSGVKPREFSYWLFELLGLKPGDEFVDIFPGSGAVTEAWNSWRSRERPIQEGLLAR